MYLTDMLTVTNLRKPPWYHKQPCLHPDTIKDPHIAPFIIKHMCYVWTPYLGLLNRCLHALCTQTPSCGRCLQVIFRPGSLSVNGQKQY